MADLTYGTPEYYAELFADILADVDKDRPGTADAILRGFYQALDDWFIYHDHQATTYDELRQRVRKALSV